MISYKNGIVKSIKEIYEDATWIEVKLDNELSKAINYNSITGKIKIGDKVVLNTTAIELSLGTGGQHFVMYNHSNPSQSLNGEGHIMKNRYTPNQMRFLTVEEEDSPYHNKVKDFKSLDNHPVIIGSLHSMLAPIAAMIKYNNSDLKINYIMTDGGALPLAFSNTIRNLKDKKLINNTITIGHAFGGDFECTNIYTGLITSKEVLKADLTIVTMGPGIVGTGTKYGFSGIDQGTQVDAVNTLGGQAILVPRISFKDKRERHYGLSHHTLTVLNDIIKTKSDVILPKLPEEKSMRIKSQISKIKLNKDHNFIIESTDGIEKALEFYELKTTTMGRGIEADYEFFQTLAAVGNYISRMFQLR